MYSSEQSDLVDEFFSSSAGRMLLNDFAEMQNSCNNLSYVMNQAKGAEHPEIEIAKFVGIVEGLGRVLQHIDSVRKGEVK